MAANVYYTLSNTTVYTDKLQISCDDTFSLQVYATALGNAAAVGNLYSQPVGYTAGVHQVYSGAGNKVTVVTASANLSALEIGTASSAQESVF